MLLLAAAARSTPAKQVGCSGQPMEDVMAAEKERNAEAGRTPRTHSSRQPSRARSVGERGGVNFTCWIYVCAATATGVAEFLMLGRCCCWLL